MILTTSNVEVRYKPRHFKSIREVPRSLIKKGVRVIVGTIDLYLVEFTEDDRFIYKIIEINGKPY